MPITEIINEIDAYLSTLRQARNLLLAPMIEPRRKRSPQRSKKVKISTKIPAVLSSQRIIESKPRPLHPIRVRKPARESVDSVAKPSSVDQRALLSKQTQASAATPIPAPDVARDASTHQPQPSPIRWGRRSIAKPRLRAKPDAPKPAIALAGPMSAKIVVVPAKQVQRERERAAHPEVQRPRVRISGLTGRRAFEALFSDGLDPSKAPVQ
jgi:hypothetical protein